MATLLGVSFASLYRVAVGDGPCRVFAQLLLGLQGPVRLAEQLAAQEHQVGVAAGDDLVGLRYLGDQADGPGLDPRRFADAAGERHLVAAADGYSLVPTCIQLRMLPSSKEPIGSRARPTQFSLRELLIATTWIGILLGLVLLASSLDERALLVLTIGGALLGAFIGRLRGQSGLRMGLICGCTGTLLVLGGMAVRGVSYFTTYAEGPAHLRLYFWLFAFDGLVAFVACTALAVLTVSIERFVRALFSGETVAWCRARPIPALLIAGAAVVAAAAAINIDSLRAPHAWAPRCVVPYGRPQLRGAGLGIALSRDGEYLAVHTWNGFKRVSADTYIYRIAGPRAMMVVDGFRPKLASYAAFSCEDNRCAVLVCEDFSRYGIHVIDLDTGTTTCIIPSVCDEMSDRFSGELNPRLEWLPGGRIALQGFPVMPVDKHSTAAKSAVFDSRTGEMLVDGEAGTYYNGRLGNVIHDNGETLVASLDTGEEIVSTPRWFAWYIISGRYNSQITISRDGKFAIHGFDRHDLTRETQVRESDRHFWTFTNSGHIVSYPVHLSPMIPRWAHLVPFGKRVATWLQYHGVRLLDPATGKAVAVTRPINRDVFDVALSYDGAVMAVATEDGVLLYDVPERFR
jgi:hypothetical protein